MTIDIDDKWKLVLVMAWYHQAEPTMLTIPMTPYDVTMPRSPDNQHRQFIVSLFTNPLLFHVVIIPHILLLVHAGSLLVLVYQFMTHEYAYRHQIARSRHWLLATRKISWGYTSGLITESPWPISVSCPDPGAETLFICTEHITSPNLSPWILVCVESLWRDKARLTR